ncbi:MAG: glycosyltransferase family 2 protein [Patescibacteria group bacterium]
MEEKKLPKVAVVYLSYHSEPYLEDMVRALQKTSYPRDRLSLVVVDNPHPTEGSSLNKINEVVLPLSGKSLPEVIVLPQEKNLGYTGGNNVGINWALDHGFDYIFLHNQDGYFASDCLAKLVKAMESDKSIGCAQALIMLAGTDRVNTAGNSFNYLGFAFIDHFGKKLSELNLKPVEEVGYASGAGLMMRSDLVKKFGSLDADLFAYHEDVEYSLRLKLAGFKVAMIRDAIFHHKYEFNRSSSKFYFMERNRYAVLLMYYRTVTLILLLPILLFMEIGLLVFFLLKGWGNEKFKIYAYWLDLKNWRMWLSKRKKIQQLRTIGDRELVRMSAGKIIFGVKPDMNNPLLVYVANPLMVVYRAIVRVIIFW